MGYFQQDMNASKTSAKSDSWYLPCTFYGLHMETDDEIRVIDLLESERDESTLRSFHSWCVHEKTGTAQTKPRCEGHRLRQCDPWTGVCARGHRIRDHSTARGNFFRKEKRLTYQTICPRPRQVGHWYWDRLGRLKDVSISSNCLSNICFPWPSWGHLRTFRESNLRYGPFAASILVYSIVNPWL